jgi:small subunit ribosomal protein S17
VSASEQQMQATGPERGRRKTRQGVVVSDKMDKTVLVRIDRQMRHPLYKKIVRRSSKLAAHDERNDAHVGDTVRVMETRPMSKNKRWRVIEIVERAK